MFRYCRSDSLPIDYIELRAICLFYIFLLVCFFIWCLRKKHYENEINRKHKWKNSKSSYKNEKAEFFNYIYESNDLEEVIVRQEGYQNSHVGFFLKNVSIVLYLFTHIIILSLIANEYCIYENNEVLWNHRAFIFFIFFLLSFIITYGILTVRKHMHSFFLKPSLLKHSDYVLVYTKNDDYVNVYKNEYLKQSYNFSITILKKCYTVLNKKFYIYINMCYYYWDMLTEYIFPKKWKKSNKLTKKCINNEKNLHNSKVKGINKYIQHSVIYGEDNIKRKSEQREESEQNEQNEQSEQSEQSEQHEKNVPLDRLYTINDNKTKERLKIEKVKVRTNEKNIKYFFFKSMKYIYNEEKDAFYNISNNIKNKINNLNFLYILKKGGLNNKEIINNINEYGYNNIHIDFYSFFKNFKRELLDGIYMFQLFITYKNLFWKEIITSLIWIIISLLTVIKKIIKNEKNKKEIYNNIQINNNNNFVTVYRNSIIQNIPSNNLTIGDIIIISSNMIMPCDCLLLTGHVLVDESLLTGESRPMKKTSIYNFTQYNNSFNFHEKDNFTFTNVHQIPNNKIKRDSKKMRNSLEINNNRVENKNCNQIFRRIDTSVDRQLSHGRYIHTNGSHENGSHENGSHEKGSHEKGSHEKGSHENGSHENGSHENRFHANRFHANRFHANNVLYAGTNVLSTLNSSENIYAIVTSVSIYTYKGKYMQNVLFPNPLLFKYDSQLPIVFIFTVCFSLICLYFQIQYLGLNMTSIFYSIGTLSQILPIWTPVVLNIGLNISTHRLKKEKSICCIAPSRIPICGKIRIFFFDKTGTLTDHKIEFSGVHFCNNILRDSKTLLASNHVLRNQGLLDSTHSGKVQIEQAQNGQDQSFLVENSHSGNKNCNTENHQGDKDVEGNSIYSSIEEDTGVTRTNGKEAKEDVIPVDDDMRRGGKEEKKAEEHHNDSKEKHIETQINSQESSGDVFQSYDEMEEQRCYEEQIKEVSMYREKEERGDNMYTEHIEEEIKGKDVAYSSVKNESIFASPQNTGEDRISSDNTYFECSKEKENCDNFAIDVDSDKGSDENFMKEEQTKKKVSKMDNCISEEIDSKNEEENEKGRETILRNSLFNDSNTASMNSVTSLLYNSKLMWTNRVTLKNTPSNYHMLIYALAGCSCVYHDNDKVYGNEIDKRLYEATDMKISSYISKHNKNVKRVSLKINSIHKHFDVLRTYEFDYYTKISTNLTYGYFNFKEKVHIVFSKGSFDKIYKKCIKNEEIYFFKKKEQEYSKNGYYVIGLAFRILCNMSYDYILGLSRDELEKDMNFLSLIMFNNHIKKDALDVIQTLKNSSIRPVILTGDNAYNCLHVGNKIGLFNNVNFCESFFSLSMHGGGGESGECNAGKSENESERGNGDGGEGESEDKGGIGNPHSNTSSNLQQVGPNTLLSSETKFMSFENFFKSNSKQNEHRGSTGHMHGHVPKKSKEKKKKHLDMEGNNNSSCVTHDGFPPPIANPHSRKGNPCSGEENLLLLPKHISKEITGEGNPQNRIDINICRETKSNGCHDTPPLNGHHIEEHKNFVRNYYSYYESEEGREEKNVIVYGYVQKGQLTFINIQNDNRIDEKEVLYGDIYKEIILTGEAYTYIRDSIFQISNYEEMCRDEKELDKYKRFLLRVRIFSRLTPNNKIEVIKDFINFDYITGMCGDGSNDCGALKISHAGIALSNSDSSVVSPFSSRNENIKGVIDVLREGRACLVTSINCYKYMLLYGFMISIIKIVLFMHAHAVMSEYGYLFFDNVILLLLAKSMTLSKPARKLKTQTPTSSIIGAQTILSLLCTLIVNFFFLYLIIFQFFYVYNLPSSYDMNTSAPKSSWWLMSDNYESFLACIWFCFQIVNSALILTFGDKHRKSVFSNYTFMTYYCLINLFLLYLTVGGPNRLTCLFRMNCNDEVSRKTKFKILDLVSYSASGLSFYGPNGNNILSTGQKPHILQPP
ncbi:P-type ATPase [Plasmodium ovale curtisi]|uniref:P-type ATPase n=1 Tax=Plasmodium ovale curtisi TaxID=864141 RepID=A0A1A8WN56_PLAOA|nr:P-type ATPase [Plasmodium ovale curtisi]